jgi:hypothetical protein
VRRYRHKAVGFARRGLRGGVDSETIGWDVVRGHK